MGKFSRLGNDLYTGRKSYNFVDRKALWYAISGVLVLGAILLVVFKGLNLGIEFTGGTQFNAAVDSSQATQTEADAVRTAVADSGIPDIGQPVVTTSQNNQNNASSIVVQTETLTADESAKLTGVLATTLKIAPDQISTNSISASLGSQIAQRAAIGIVVFLILVMLFIWAYAREWKMSVAALIALFHDIALTVGIYSLSGFTVTPAAVTGLLAILGFSLYDTVVVFDKVRENTRDLRGSRTTYAAAANLAVNQTLVRSINTAIVALIPIGAILYVSAVKLGASSLQDLALSQFVGMAVGVYSSLFLAPRALVHMKSTETDVKLAEKRAKARERSQADKYASVPAFTDDLPVVATTDDPDELDDAPETPTRPTPREGAMGRGRTAPPARGPMGESRSSGRAQPSRTPRSQRGKK
jgi:preprotein translocase subunit SecF